MSNDPNDKSPPEETPHSRLGPGDRDAELYLRLGAIHGAQGVALLRSTGNCCECVACQTVLAIEATVWMCHGEDVREVIPALKTFEKRLAEMREHAEGVLAAADLSNTTIN